jgi:hypothetical protein
MLCKVASSNQLYIFSGQSSYRISLAKQLKYYLEVENDFDYGKFVIIEDKDIQSVTNHSFKVINQLDIAENLCDFLINNGVIPILCLTSPVALKRRFMCEQYGGVEIFIHSQTERIENPIDCYEIPYIDGYFCIDVDVTDKSIHECFDILKSKIR